MAGQLSMAAGHNRDVTRARMPNFDFAPLD